MKKINPNKKFKIKDFIIFLLLYFFVLGSKVIYSLFELGNMVEIGVWIFAIVLLLSCFKLPAKYYGIYFASILLFTYMLIGMNAAIDIEYGYYKAFLGLCIPLLTFNIFIKRDWDRTQLQNYFVLSVLVISLIAIPYKMAFGLYTRAVPFGLLGPIPFGWVNAMALLCLTLKREKKAMDVIGIVFFFLMVIWTGSKGPLVAYGIIAIFFWNRIFGKGIKAKLMIVSIFILGFYFIQTFGDDIRSVKMIKAYIEDPQDYAEEQGGGSFGTRENFIAYSFEMVEDNLMFGVGFGAWSDNLNTRFKYPHNVYLELLTEVGVVGVSIFLCLLLTLKYRNIFGYIGILGMLCLAFSGDFSYFRYAFYPLLISTYLNKNRIR